MRASYSIGKGTGLLSSVGSSVKVLTSHWLSCHAHRLITALGGARTGSTNPDIQLTFWTNSGAFEGSIDGVPMPRDFASVV